MRRGYRRPPFLTIGVCCSYLHSTACSISIGVRWFVFSCAWCLHIFTVICTFLMFSAISFRPRRLWHLTKIQRKLCPNPFKSIPKSIKIDQSGAHERSKSDLGSKSVPGYEKERYIFLEISDFGRHLGDFGRHLVPNWEPKGSKNREFWHQDAPKAEKMPSRMRH